LDFSLGSVKGPFCPQPARALPISSAPAMRRMPKIAGRLSTMVQAL
jgi:hypothetical protein